MAPKLPSAAVDGSQVGSLIGKGSPNDPYKLDVGLGFDSNGPEEMQTLVYSPDVRVLVASGGKQYDVSHDLVGGSVLRRENAASSLVLRLANKEKRYDGRFHRMDRITIFLKRVKWIQTFTGYLDEVPLLNLRPGVVTLRATCTLKRLLHTWWDPGLPMSIALLRTQLEEGGNQGENARWDSGLGGLLARVLVEVGGWQLDQIHVQEIPRMWIDFLSQNLGQMSDENRKATEEFRRLILGSGDTSGGIGSQAGYSYDTTLGATIPIGDTKLFYVTQIVAACDERSMGPTTRDVSVGQSIREAGEKGLETNRTNTGITGGDDSPAWEGVVETGTRYENESRNSDAAILGVATALVETELTMYANNAIPESLNYPHERVGVDHDSIGLFQQRAAGWGTVQQRMNAQASAGMFFNELQKYDWRNMDPGLACARVQRPRKDLEYKYGLRMEEAKRYVEQARAGQDVSTTSVAPIPQGVSSVAGVVGNPTTTGISAPTAIPTGGNKPVPDSEDAVRYAAMQIGKPYIWGARGPDGFDCSGLWDTSFKSIGLNIGGTTYTQMTNGFEVPPSQVRRGDLVFPHAGHVVMWMGDGTVLHSPTTGDVVKIAPVYFNINNVASIRRYAENGGPTSLPNIGNPYTMVGAGAPPVGSGTTTGQSEAIARNLFSYLFEKKFDDQVSKMFRGEKAFINDEPLIQIVQTLSRAGLRNFASAPNGDFMAYYPDYFGMDGKQAVLQLEEIEMKDVSINFNDDALTTHVYVAGDHVTGTGQGIGLYGWLESFGVATVENKYLFNALTAMSLGFPEQMSGPQLMKHFGVRPYKQEFSSVYSRELEFLVACQIFMEKWAEQFSTHVEFTFMPELYPGMRISLSGHNMQVYVSEVVHTFDFEEGFTTSATIMAPSNPNVKNMGNTLSTIFNTFTDKDVGGTLTDFLDRL